MKYCKALSALAITALFVMMATGTSAYSLYPQGKVAVSSEADYIEKISELNVQMNESVGYYSLVADSKAETTESEEDKENDESTKKLSAEDFVKLYSDRLALLQEYTDLVRTEETSLVCSMIDYDVALKKLGIMLKRYREQKMLTQQLYSQYQTGLAEKSDAEDSQKTVDDMLLDIKSALFDISVMKTSIEQITGETLTDSYDFNSLYLITDGLAIDTEALYDMSQFSSLCVPEGYESDYERAECEATEAVQAFYALGSSLRDYLSAVVDEKNGEIEVKLGLLSQSDFKALTLQKDEKYIAAVEAKAAYTKTLLALDDESGGGLTIQYGYSGGLIGQYSATLPKEKTDQGLFGIVKSGKTNIFLVLQYPDEIDPEECVGYAISYCSQKAGITYNSDSGCTLKDMKYQDQKNNAIVTFYMKDAALVKYKIDVFSPIGRFRK